MPANPHPSGPDQRALGPSTSRARTPPHDTPAVPPAPPPTPSPPSVRVRFEVTARHKGGGVHLSAVQATDPTHPNYQFWTATPAGRIELAITNEAAASAFELGREYDVTFSPLPTKATAAPRAQPAQPQGAAKKAKQP